MARRPTIRDLAEASGVSVATVDRVLNGRLPVREETARRVYEAATRLGYHATGLIRQRMRRDLPAARLGFVLLRQDQRQFFYQAFDASLRGAVDAAQGARASALIEFAETPTPTDVIAALGRISGRVDAIAMVAPDHPSVTAAVQGCRDRGIAVFSLLSDFAPGVREGYVGLNNRKAGRAAAWTIANIARRPGKVAVFVGSHRFHGHELREIGFRAFFREQAPEFEILETLINLETRQITHEVTLSLLARYPDLTGLYVAGGGMEGAISALREADRRLVTVINEVTPDTREALTDGTVTMLISTPLPALCRDLVALMLHAIANGPAEAPGQTFLPFDLFLPESL